MSTPLSITFTRQITEDIKPVHIPDVLSAVKMQFSLLGPLEFTRENDKLIFKKRYYTKHRFENLIGLADLGSVELDVYSHTINYTFSVMQSTIVYVCIMMCASFLLHFFHFNPLYFIGLIVLGIMFNFFILMIFASKVTKSVNTMFKHHPSRRILSKI